jgi:hypothetical protein
MAKSPKPGLLRIHPHVTPSPNDPPGADKLYRAFGMAIIAWGRLEGLFVACLMMVIQIANDKRIRTKLPMKWERQAIIWEDAFERIPSLKSLKREAAVSTICRKIAILWFMGFLRAFSRSRPSPLKS